MSTNAQTVTALEAQHVLQTYKRQPVVFVRGEGSRLFDASGRAYLDFISGIGVVVLGHGHPGLAAVIADQAKTLIHTSNLYYHPLQGQLAATLSSLSGLQRAFFCNSGTEAVEACLKFARRYWYSKGVKNRTAYVALEHGFSGRTMGVVGDRQRATATVRAASRRHLRVAGRCGEARAAVNERPPRSSPSRSRAKAACVRSPEFAAAIAGAKKTGTLLIADEIQCGLGRTGWPFQFQALGWSPDLVTVAGDRIGHSDRRGAGRRTRRDADFPGDTAQPTAATRCRPGRPSTCSSSCQAPWPRTSRPPLRCSNSGCRRFSGSTGGEIGAGAV